MSSTESEKNTLEEQLNEDVNNPESNNTSLLSSEESSTKNKEETSQENQTELSEIETGVSDQSDFDEIINFDHTYLNYRIAKVFLDRESLENSTFDLLTTNIFIYSGDIIDFKSSILINSSNKNSCTFSVKLGISFINDLNSLPLGLISGFSLIQSIIATVLFPLWLILFFCSSAISA